ncbi:RNA polymerase sigma factor [Paludifilum halophilum]|uniref:RNA polymerase sigma factor n=1 Tax=Paludifilum halophilum TaxID=1642702 RepID=A0A235B5F3_9BACL|nr:RNA polymerase sigma factor [Paludifilum halophilum]OYD07523.1 hypothetical protein CHM34_11555 [Paludifilum halophilum]
MTVEEQKIIRQIQAGSRELYRVIVERYQQRVYAVALQATGHPKDAEDLAQEIFLQAYRSLSSYRYQAQFSTWLYRIAINKALDWKRRKARSPSPHPAVDVEKELATSFLPEPTLLKKEEQNRLRQMVDRLPDKYRCVVVRYYFNHDSYEIIADDLGIAKKTVETRLYRAKKLLQSIGK